VKKKLSETIQLEQLLNEKASMEDEGRELDEKQSKLKTRVRALTERIIEELRRKNDAKQESVNSLQSKINELEQELSTLSEPKPTKRTEENVEAAPETGEIDTAFEKESQETNGDTVSVTEVAQEEDVSAESKDKKRRFF
jgi:predicted nuclease with TOPRIM domain